VAAADPALFDYKVNWDGSQLTLEVKNLGIKSSSAGTVRCSRGLPNDFVAYDTGMQEWTAIGEAAVPALAPGKGTNVTIPWSSEGLVLGYWPISCTMDSEGDGYPDNNTATHVFKKD
jgi:hypothetical protein